MIGFLLILVSLISLPLGLPLLGAAALVYLFITNLMNGTFSFTALFSTMAFLISMPLGAPWLGVAAVAYFFIVKYLRDNRSSKRKEEEYVYYDSPRRTTSSYSTSSSVSDRNTGQNTSSRNTDSNGVDIDLWRRLFDVDGCRTSEYKKFEQESIAFIKDMPKIDCPLTKANVEALAVGFCYTGIAESLKKRNVIISIIRKGGSRCYSVYHIREIGNADTSVGYIGVTNNIERRKREHIDGLVENFHPNKILLKAYKTGIELEIEVLHKNLTQMEALSYEHHYRRMPLMGWNQDVGGKEGYHFFKYHLPMREKPISGSYIYIDALCETGERFVIPHAEKILGERL